MTVTGRMGIAQPAGWSGFGEWKENEISPPLCKSGPAGGGVGAGICERGRVYLRPLPFDSQRSSVRWKLVKGPAKKQKHRGNHPNARDDCK